MAKTLISLQQSNLTKVTQPLPIPSANNSASDPGYSKAEQARKQGISKRREALGIDNAFLVSLVNQMFYTKHPELNGRQLGKGAEDEGLRADWDKQAIQILDRLQLISQEARSRMGRYTEMDLKDRQTAVNQLNLSSRALNDLTDAQFFICFQSNPVTRTC